MKNLIDKLTALFYILLIIGTILLYSWALALSVNNSIKRKELISVEIEKIKLEIKEKQTNSKRIIENQGK